MVFLGRRSAAPIPENTTRMEKEKTLEGIEGPPASTAAFVALPDAGGSVANDHLPRERPWWRVSAPARLLTRLTSGGDGHGRHLRHAQTMEDATANGPRPDDGFHPARAFLRALSSLTDATPPPVEKFRCYICFEDVPVAEAVTLSSCGHRYCQSCLQSYLTNQISEGHVHPVCFHPIDAGHDPNPDEQVRTTPQITCGVAVADDQIQSIVHADVWTKFNKFRFNQKHQHARECPHCSFTQECAGPSNPSCVCSQCERPFCFFHGNAHEYGTCSDYELKIAEAEALNRAVINKLAKPCPGCSRDIEKDGGCNHMTCVACQTSFCWLCGKEVESVANPSHFDPAGDGACSGKQFDAVLEAPGTAGAEAPRRAWYTYSEDSGFSFFVFVVVMSLVFVIMAVLILFIAPVTWLCTREQSRFKAAMGRILPVLCIVLLFMLSPVTLAVYCTEFALALAIQLIALVCIGIGMLVACLCSL